MEIGSLLPQSYMNQNQQPGKKRPQHRQDVNRLREIYNLVIAFNQQELDEKKSTLMEHLISCGRLRRNSQQTKNLDFQQEYSDTDMSD